MGKGLDYVRGGILAGLVLVGCGKDDAIDNAKNAFYEGNRQEAEQILAGIGESTQEGEILKAQIAFQESLEEFVKKDVEWTYLTTNNGLGLFSDEEGAKLDSRIAKMVQDVGMITEDDGEKLKAYLGSGFLIKDGGYIEMNNLSTPQRALRTVIYAGATQDRDLLRECWVGSDGTEKQKKRWIKGMEEYLCETVPEYINQERSVLMFWEGDIGIELGGKQVTARYVNLTWERPLRGNPDGEVRRWFCRAIFAKDGNDYKLVTVPEL